MQAQVVERVDRLVADLGCEDHEIKLWKLGRHLTVRVTLLMPDDAAPITYPALDRTRAQVHDALRDLAPTVRVDLMFTSDRRWMDPPASAE